MYVFDTHVLVAALYSRNGASFWLLREALSGRIPCAVSVALALEYEDVLLRERVSKLSWASKVQISNLLDAFFACAALTSPIRAKLRPFSQDPSDDLVIECAIEAGALAIVTSNLRDFKGVAGRFKLDVVTPGQLVQRLKSGEI